MDNAEQILVIIVSTVLSLFLIFAIIATFYIVKILKQIKRVTEQAERAAINVESAAEMFSRAAGPLSILKVVGSIVDQVSKSKRKDR